MSVGTRPTLVIHPTVGGTGEPLSPTGSTPGLSASTGNSPLPPPKKNIYIPAIDIRNL